MLYLYHGTTSVCAIKVRLALAEKALPWQGELLWLQRGDQYRPDYLKLNPNAVVPTLVHDGKAIIESTVILEYLDETFPDIPLMPRDPYARSQARLWLKRVDELHVHCGTITAAVAFRRYFMRQTPDGRDAYVARILDPIKRERLQRIMDNGLAAPDAMDATRRYNTFVGAMESALAQSDYLVGNSFTFADVAAIPTSTAPTCSASPAYGRTGGRASRTGMRACGSGRALIPPSPPTGTTMRGSASTYRAMGLGRSRVACSTRRGFAAYGRAAFRRQCW